MSSMGVFRKMGMDLVYTLTQIDNITTSGEALAIDSGGDDLPLQPLFFCPRARIKFLKSKLKKDEYGYVHKFLPFNSSPYFPTTRSVDQQGESLLDCDHHKICKLPVVPLFWCNNQELDSDEFECGACERSMISQSYYKCLECERTFHKECVESPLEIKHPSHPFHSLQLCSNSKYVECLCCDTSLLNMFYHCNTCDLSMHQVCAMKSIPFVEDHPKSHPHPLTFFPTQASLVCHICGMIKNLDPTYICIQCVFVIHKGCIGFPHVIRISRHPHRISFTSSLPSSGALSCGVCRQRVDNNYGAYASNKCESYFVHSKCAIHPKVWDGIELEGVPEEDDMIDDGEPFERISDGIILHPCHGHNMRLEISKAYDDKRYCRGCALPIYQGKFYSCMECEYILHKSCASAPRMKRHPLHPHPLTLKFACKTDGVSFCNACERYGTGFFYKHHKEMDSIQLDLRCALIIEPFEYQGHKHPLYLDSDLMKKAQCPMCKYESAESKLSCLECDYVICFSCATFPYKARYKHDSHFLKICDGKEASDQPEWCEVCEGKIEEVKRKKYYDYQGNLKTEKRYYKCSECCNALHVECLLGKDIHMKPSQAISEYITFSKYSAEMDCTVWIDVQIHLNTSLSRPVCTQCLRRCPFPIFFKEYEDNTIFCSWECIGLASAG